MSRALTPLVLAVVSALAVPAMAQQAEKPSPEMTQLLAAARMWEAKNRTDIARGILDKALLIDPNQPDALMLLGLIEIRSNRPLEADKILRKLRQRAPNHPATLELEDTYRIATRDKQEMARIRLLARAGKSEEAIARLRQLFPRGAPRGELAVDYYRIMAGTPAGRTASIAELRARVRQDPDDLRLTMALASLLTDREATRQEGLGILYRIVQRPDGDRKSALEMWRRTLYGVSDDAAYFKWFELYVKEVPDDTADELRSLRADLLSLQGEQLLAQRKQSPALARLEESIRLAPKDPWTRFTLARAYRDLALPALGRRVVEDGMAASPTSEMRYATALYLNSVDDIDAASSVLAGVPEAERSDSMRRLAGNLQAQRLLREARQLVAAGREQQAEDKLRAAADAARDDPQMLASVGREWIAIGQPDTGLRLVRDWLDAHPQDPAIDVRIRYGELLASAERDDELRAWIAESSALPGITPEQRADFDDQLLRLALRDTDRRIADGDLKGAERMLYAVPAAQQNDRRWLLELADLREAQGDYDGAAQAAREVLTTHPQDADARLTVARMLERQGKEDQALEEVRAVLADTPEDDIDTRLAVARRFTAMRREDEALAVVTPLRERYPERSDVTMQAGRIAQSRGDFNGAAVLYREARVQEQRENEIPGPQGTSAERALGALEARREGQVSTAVLFSNKSGDPGISRLSATEIPLYVRIPNGYTGHAFFHADTVLLDAGTLPADSLPGSRDFGKIRALGNNGLGPISQSDRGVALAAGYEFNGAYNSWRADIGTTPLGFTLQTVVGGFRYRAEMGPASATVDISRREVTSSLVSYAGATDPRHVDAQTGAVTPAESWGNVVRNGIHARYARDVGRFGLFADLGYGVYTGTNVLTNQEFTVRTGFDVPVFVRRDQRITSGVVLNYWRYAENERFYTFGHGGYYSPQKYLSFLIPLDWTGRRGLLSWRLRGSVGMSSTYEKSMDIYPTRPDLQAMVGGAQYEGGSGGGFSYTVGGIVEYRFAPHWVAGAGFDIDRSRDYAPNRAFAYVRYFFERQQGAVPYPPTTVRPYSTY
ncbi:cellulose biosynthesis protein BcsC [Cupriavidus pinatubonensis]|uniref:Cellulose synthase operon protein C n=1 Tax=Cupriavidus pinatubonensis TaxID=248026 RepID=A0ABM8WXU8_9BURK|nr:cellulose biosynthesis protein BcsC [Cupriavidus pinatubonensis]CAG9172369.1 Cellulose synthase operon protein C [Cupriavidus pinatubonensis]